MQNQGKVLIAYVSVTGNTKRMADFIAEGVRMVGQEAVLKGITQLKQPDDLHGYDAYIFGSPTYHRDMVQGMKTFLFLAKKADLTGKVGGAFGSYTHSGDAAKIIFDTMEHVFKMDMSNLGSFNMLEEKIDTDEGLHSCQDYGKAIAEQLS